MAMALSMRRISAFRLAVAPLFLAGLLGGLVMGGLVCLFVYLLQQGRDDAEAAADANAANIVQIVEHDVARNIEFFDMSLQGIVRALADPLVSRLGPRARQLALFDNSANASYINSTVVLDEWGHITDESSSLIPRIGEFADRDYFRIHRDRADVGLFIGRPIRSRLSNDLVVSISRRVNKDDGSFGGVVVGTIQVAYFQSLLKNLSLGANGTVSLVLRDGTLIARDPLPPGGPGIYFGNANLFKHYPAETSGRFVDFARSDGVRRRFTFREVKGLPIVVVVGQAFDDIYGPSWKRAVGLGIITAILLAAMIVLACLLARELARRQRSDVLLRQSEARYRLLTENSSDAIVLRDANGLRTYASPSFYQMVGRSAEELGTRSITEYIDRAGQEATRSTYPRLRAGERSVVSCFEYPHPNGSTMWIEAVSSAIFGDDGSMREVVTNMRDVTQHKRIAAELATAATTDGLTGLLNRRALDDRLATEWKRAVRTSSTISILLLDVDFFKAYNDAFGHMQGDNALQMVAETMRSNLRRPTDVAARYGGEEFVGILANTDLSGAMFVAERIRHAVIKAAMKHPTNSIGILTVSIGIASARPQADDPIAGLMAAADSALYLAKANGRNQCSIGVAIDLEDSDDDDSADPPLRRASA
jgi:diguanylate cyclase (GGDEF)-like protein/PAS domain S-box-containing protein